LVGGQAVNFWEDFLLKPDASRGPLTSKDIDFAGTGQDVELCAVRLAGTAHFPTMDHHTPTVGVVSYVDSGGLQREIDFIDAPLGIDGAALQRTSLPFEVLDDDGSATGASFRVMHPVLCMESRVCNTMTLPGYDTPHAQRQVAVSIQCAREFLEQVLLPRGSRPVLVWNERIFQYCLRDPSGRRIVLEHADLDPFGAVLVHPRLPSKFVGVRHPQMVAALKASRARHSATARVPR
jgi:hypothetical protein